MIACWPIADLAEAAVHSGHVEEGRARVAQVQAATGDSPAMWIAVGLRHARALLADDDREAGERFEEALARDATRPRKASPTARSASGSTSRTARSGPRLYRTFPKLGITARNELASALSGR